jgi:ABC-2 type transport system permease protein
LNRRRLWAIIKKEFIQIRRDRPSLAIAFLMPVFMILLFGYAVNTNVNNMPMAVLDYDQSQAGRLLAEQFVATGYFTDVAHPDNYREALTLLAGNKVKTVLVIPQGYERSLKRGDQATVQFLVDGSDPLFARTAFQTAGILGVVESQAMLATAAADAGRPLPPGPGVNVEVRALYNPGLESLKFNVPGLIGLIMQNITVMLTAFALVRERERGTLEQLMVTPIRGSELMLGKLAPYVLIAFVDIAISLAIGTLWFHVPIRGSIALLLGLSLVFLLFALGIGMLISTVTKTQLQAMQATILVILPSILLSGFVFPRSSMPPFLQYLGDIIPLTYFLDILRGIMLKGTGLTELWPDVAAMTLFGVFVVTMASLKFRKRVE